MGPSPEPAAGQPTAQAPPGAVAVVVGMGRVYAVSGVLLLATAIGGVLLFSRLWGTQGEQGGWIFWPLVVAGIVVHEGLHGLAMVLCGVPPGEVRFGIQVSRGAAFATTRRPLSVGAYRFVLVLPLLLLGLAPLAVGLAIGNALVVKLGTFMVAGAGGDVAVLLALRRVGGTASVMDHPSEPGCYVLPG